MENYYVAISRQFGSLGRPIAQKLAEIMKIEYYDRDIVEAVAAKMGISVKSASNQDETLTSPFARMANPLGSGSGENQNEIFRIQTQVIQNLAKKGPAIFVGRCADYILREEKCLNVFIYAPKAQRYLNCVNSMGMSPSEAKSMIEKVDRARDRYYLRYAKHLPSDPEFSHLMVDSSLFGVNGTAELLASVIHAHFMDIDEE